MVLHILGSSSKGNCYVLESGGGERLMIEAGLPWKKLREAMDFDFSDVVGCLVTHEHNDHAQSAVEIRALGVDIAMSGGTFDKIFGNRFFSKSSEILYPNRSVSFGRFRVLPFTTYHDCAEPLGFLINHPEMGTLAFITDTYKLSNTFTGVNHWMIEANFCETLVTPEQRGRDRLLRSHLSIQSTLEVLKENDLSATRTIVLTHLSDRNSDAVRFKQLVEAATGKYTVIADKGMTIEL